jgi:hypothetical protein
MRKTYLMIFGLIILVSCDKGERSQLTKDKIEIEKEENEIETLIQNILDLPELQWIYHPEANDRLPVKLLASGLVTKELNLNKFDRDVLILTRDELETRKIPDYVNIEELSFVRDTVKFYLTYDVEGAVATGKFVKVQGRWTPLDYTVEER